MGEFAKDTIVSQLKQAIDAWAELKRFAQDRARSAHQLGDDKNYQRFMLAVQRFSEAEVMAINVGTLIEAQGMVGLFGTGLPPVVDADFGEKEHRHG